MTTGADTGEIISTYLQAEEFHTASRILEGEVAKRQAGQDGNISAPLITNLSFACELYLKALILRNQPSAQGHDLGKLWDRLHEADRVLIQARLHLMHILPNIRAEDVLRKCKDAFIEWRYANEKSSLSIEYCELRRCADALRESFAELEPGLASKYQLPAGSEKIAGFGFAQTKGGPTVLPIRSINAGGEAQGA